jgi:hypothetical protein
VSNVLKNDQASRGDRPLPSFRSWYAADIRRDGPGGESRPAAPALTVTRRRGAWPHLDMISA